MSACTEVYLPGYGSTSVIPCARIDADNSGRHRGRHYGWENMPGGERRVSVPDPARPGWSTGGTETYEPWVRLWTWSRAGASGSSRRGGVPTVCPDCGTLDYPEGPTPSAATLYTGSPDAYAVAGDPNPQACYHCRLWAERIINYTAGWQRRSPRDRRMVRLIRLRNEDGTPSARLSSWAEGITGAFGDRAYTVRWDDGDQRGPASSMWDSGEIPWWLDDQFPPNAVIVRSTL